jgi:hypothetical protein
MEREVKKQLTGRIPLRRQWAVSAIEEEEEEEEEQEEEQEEQEEEEECMVRDNI